MHSGRLRGDQGECNRRPAATPSAFALRLTAMLLLASLWTALPATAALEEARYLREAERLFTRGIMAYQEEDLKEARDRFLAITELPANQRSGAALLMLGRALLRLDEPAAAVDAARRLLREAPGSRYDADARMVAGDGYYSLKRYYEAATEYARILGGTGPIAVKASAAERLAAIVRNRSITSEALDRIRQQLGAEALDDAILFGEARWYERLGWAELGRRRLATYADSLGPAGMFHQVARARLAGPIPRPAAAPPPVDLEPAPAQVGGREWTPDAGREGVPRLGVLVPVTGREAAIGRDLLAGVHLANEEQGEPFDVVVVDTGTEYADFEGEAVPIYQSDANRMVRVVAGARFLVDQVGVLAIVGPLFSTSTAAAAAVAEAAGVPLIAPLAQQSGLDTLGRHVFQLNPIPEVQGQALAEYATLVLGLQTLAILSPLSDYGFGFEQAFTRTAADNGGRIVHSDWYVPEQAKDFQVQFEALRQIGFAIQPAPAGADTVALFDSLEVALLDTSLEGQWTFQELVDAAGWRVDGEAQDSSEIFIDSIDGVAVVVEVFDDARTIAPQLRFHRLQTQVLGNDIWYDPEAIAQLLPMEREHVQGCIFVSRRQGSEREQSFIDRFRARMGRDPGYAAAGYDAAHIAIDGWLAGHRSRVELRQYLADLRRYEGASGRLSFSDSRRVNSELAPLTIDRAGRVRPLRAEDLPPLVDAGPDADLPTEDLPRAALPSADGDSLSVPSVARP